MAPFQLLLPQKSKCKGDEVEVEDRVGVEAKVVVEVVEATGAVEVLVVSLEVIHLNKNTQVICHEEVVVAAEVEEVENPFAINHR